MKIFGSLTSPYARKVRILILEKQLSCELVVADPHAADSVVPQHNPLGLVPVLVRDDGVTLFDSPVIVEYLDTLKAPALIAATGESRWAALRWMALADGLLDMTVARLMELRRPTAQQSAEAQQRREQKIVRALAFAEKNLANPFLIDDRLTMADIALAVALEYVDFRYPHDWRSRHPRLAEWLMPLSARPTFVETRPPK
ncbi:MAG: glutathione S-transferase N-terminal domain-containing protein [Gammaproteobacteria bacterium]|nr:glutathione S-transferase N-terminal domain-containing protein [Gammaproteobacteria bacterium]